jgi:hypothetical protein
MNKNYMFFGFITVAALGIIGAAFLYLIQSPGADKFVAYIFNTLVMLGSIATMLWGLNKAHNQQEKTDAEVTVIKAQTNGQLHARDERIKELEEQLTQSRVREAVATTRIETVKDKSND